MDRSHDTLLAHAGSNPERDNGSVAPPIVMSSTFLRDDNGGYTPAGGHCYGRTGNPTRASLEEVLAELEHGKAAFTFGSGLAAASAVFQCLETGKTVILPDDMYFGVKALLDHVYARWGLAYKQVDLCKLEALAEALDGGKVGLVWVETPTNPLLKICDIAAICALAAKHDVPVAVDATWTPPLITRPLELGASLVVHSSTKYFGGHSDVTGGVVICRDSLPTFEGRLRSVQKLGGAVPSPFDCWLILRGLRSLSVRLSQQCQTAAELATFLNAHPNVERVFYPGLESHPNHAIAKRQMNGCFGAMLSFLVAGTKEQAWAVHTKLKLFTMATSLGATESLVEHRASVESVPTSPQNLLRLSVGLERAADLVADLEQAFAQIFAS